MTDHDAALSRRAAGLPSQPAMTASASCMSCTGTTSSGGSCSGSALVGHLADPLMWLVGLGFGIGSLLPTVGGLTYLEFLGSGMLCYSVMNSASFEALYSAFTRLKHQRTWEGILHAPMTVTDIVVGEWLWAALKGALSGAAILLVMAALGLLHVVRRAVAAARRAAGRAWRSPASRWS